MVRLERMSDYRGVGLERWHCTVNLSNPPQLGMPVLWWIGGFGGLERFEHSTCIYWEARVN